MYVCVYLYIIALCLLISSVWQDHPERKAELDAMGFEWRLRENTHRQQVGAETFQLIVEASTYIHTYSTYIHIVHLRTDEARVLFTYPSYPDNIFCI